MKLISNIFIAESLIETIASHVFQEVIANTSESAQYT